MGKNQFLIQTIDLFSCDFLFLFLSINETKEIMVLQIIWTLIEKLCSYRSKKIKTLDLEL